MSEDDVCYNWRGQWRGLSIAARSDCCCNAHTHCNSMGILVKKKSLRHYEVLMSNKIIL